MAALVAEAVAAAGLVVSGHVQLLDEDAPPDRVRAAVDSLYDDDPDSDVVVVVRIPTVGGPDTVLQEAVAQRAARYPADHRGVHLRPARPHAEADGPRRRRPRVDRAPYSTPEDAALALGHAARYARWRDGDRGRPLHPEGAETQAARRLVAGWLDAEAAGDAALALDASGRRSCATIGVSVLPSTRVHDADEAVAAAEQIGWPVALKTTVAALRHRADLGGVRLDVADEAELRADVAQVLALAAGLGTADGDEPLEVQAMAPHGSACVVRSVEDPLFGPIVGSGWPVTRPTCWATSRTASRRSPTWTSRSWSARRGRRPAVRLPRAAGARRRRARGRHRAGRGARRRPPGAALAGALTTPWTRRAAAW